MSIWTHVVAAIRFDGISDMFPPPNLGNTADYDSPQSDWDKCDVPCGSEGSLKTLLWTNPSNSMARWTATIFGDLRGDFTMSRQTPIWVANYGESGVDDYPMQDGHCCVGVVDVKDGEKVTIITTSMDS